jgi:hypothetical protein
MNIFLKTLLYCKIYLKYAQLVSSLYRRKHSLTFLSCDVTPNVVWFLRCVIFEYEMYLAVFFLLFFCKVEVCMGFEQKDMFTEGSMNRM